VQCLGEEDDSFKIVESNIHNFRLSDCP